MSEIKPPTLRDFDHDNLKCFKSFWGKKVHIIHPVDFGYKHSFLCGKSANNHPDDELLTLSHYTNSDKEAIYTTKIWDIMCVSCLHRLHGIVYRFENE